LRGELRGPLEEMGLALRDAMEDETATGTSPTTERAGVAGAGAGEAEGAADAAATLENRVAISRAATGG